MPTHSCAAVLSLLLALPVHAGDPRFSIKRGDKFGAIDNSGQVVIPAQFDDELAFHDGVSRVRVGNRIGYVDTSGQTLIAPSATLSLGSGDFAQQVPLAAAISGDFGDGRAPFVLDGKYGYVDTHGSVVIQATFEQAGPFVDGRALVRSKGLYGMIDRSGAFVVEPRFEQAFTFRDGLAAVVVRPGGYGYIDPHGKMVIAPQFNYAFNFSGERARAQVPGGYGFIDRKGKVAVPPAKDFRIGSDFHEGRTPVRVEGKGWGYLDEKGAFAIAPQFFGAAEFSHGLAAVAVGDFNKHAWGYVDRSGKLVVPARYDKVEPFVDERAVVFVRGEGFSVIDTSGERVAGPLGDAGGVDAYRDGLARVWRSQRTDASGRWDYIDERGKVVWKGE